MDPNNGDVDPEEHAIKCWKAITERSQSKSILILAHSHGGVLTCNILKECTEEQLPRIKAIAMTDSVHSTFCLPPSNAARSLLKQKGCNWVSSSEPRDTVINESAIPRRISSGHARHEWTTCSARSSFFSFFDSMLGSISHPTTIEQSQPEGSQSMSLSPNL